ncbi:MAG: hypothetical protein ACPGTP_07875 [Bacteroidia bacterium]
MTKIPTSHAGEFTKLALFVHNLACPFEDPMWAVNQENCRFRTLKAAAGLFAEVHEWDNEYHNSVSEAADVIFWCIELNSTLPYINVDLPKVDQYTLYDEIEKYNLIDLGEKYARTSKIRNGKKKVNDAKNLARLARYYTAAVLDSPILARDIDEESVDVLDLAQRRYVAMKVIEDTLYKKLGARHHVKA